MFLKLTKVNGSAIWINFQLVEQFQSSSVLVAVNDYADKTVETTALSFGDRIYNVLEKPKEIISCLRANGIGGQYQCGSIKVYDD